MLVLAHRLHRIAACWLVLLVAGGPVTSTGGTVPEDPREGGGSGTPTISIDQSVVVGATGDPTNPGALLTVSDPDGPVGELVITVASTNDNVLPAANVTIEGSGEERAVGFEPVGRGTTEVTFTATDADDNSAEATMSYAASVTAPDPSGRYHHHISDASSALDVGDGHMLLINDETNTIFLHPQDVSGPPEKTWTFTPGELGTDDEIDFESMARSGELLVISGSHGNNRSGSSRPERRTFVGATVTGSGADVEVAFLGRYNGLWSDLRTWDSADGHGLGADFLGFVAGTASGVEPNPPNGFNIEAMEFAPGGEVLYLGFRAPTIEIEGVFHALLVPVLNVDEIVDGVPAPGLALFGDPIFLDLDGRSIRAMRRNEHGEYLISAGPSPQNDTWAIYAWDGEPGSDAQFNRLLPNPNPFTGGTWESIAYVPHPPVAGAEARLVTDSGDTNFYGTGPTKDLPQPYQKSYSQLFALQGEGGGTASITIVPASLSATLSAGEIETQSLTIGNVGNAELSWQVTEDDGCALPMWIEADPRMGSIPAAGEQGMDVTFDAADLVPGGYQTTLCVASNAPEHPMSTVSLSLTVTAVPVFTPTDLEVDWQTLSSDGNAVFEPGEIIEVAPAWRNDTSELQSLSGAAAAFQGPGGATYTLSHDEAEYGVLDAGQAVSCRDTEICYQMGVDIPAARPATHWSATFDEALSNDATKTWTLHIGESFVDVPRESPFYVSIETLLHHGVTGGCASSTAGTAGVPAGRDGARPLQAGGGTAYCPGGVNTRAQMAVFLIRALEGGDYIPPACEEGDERFDDVAFDNPFCPWIEELAERQVTSGCAGRDYCPGNSVTRAQMAVFLLKAAEDTGYTPPSCTGEFLDVTCPSTFAAWIEELAARDITGGCTANPPAYCPATSVTRAQMAAFVTNTFGLTLYGP